MGLKKYLFIIILLLMIQLVTAIDINLTSPIDDFQTNNTEINFSFIVTGNLSEFLCNISVDGSRIANVTNTNNSDEGVLKNISIGVHYWNVTCSGNNSIEQSETRFLNISNSSCVIPTNSMNINSNTIFCNGDYNLIDGITISSDNIELDCNNALILGNNTDCGQGSVNGINVNNHKNVTIKNCKLRYYVRGLYDLGDDNKINNNFFNKTCLSIATGNNIDSSLLISNNFFLNSSSHVLYGAFVNSTISHNLFENSINVLSFTPDSENNTILNNSFINSGFNPSVISTNETINITFSTVSANSSLKWGINQSLTNYISRDYNTVHTYYLTNLLNNTFYYFNLTKLDTDDNFYLISTQTKTLQNFIQGQNITINLTSPIDNFQTNNTEINFSFIVTGNSSEFLCNISVDGNKIANVTNANNSDEGVLKNISIGVHYWNVTCSGNNSIGYSETRMINLTNVTNNESVGCGDIIYSSTILDSDILDCNKDAIINIGSDNLTLDCNGHTLSGVGTSYGLYDLPNSSTAFDTKRCYYNNPGGDVTSCGTGIRLFNKNNVTIKNCVINKVVKGIYSAYNSHNITFYNNTITNVKTGIGVETWNVGIRSDNNLIINNMVNNASDIGIVLQYNDYSTVTSNFVNNSRYGLFSHSGGGGTNIGTKIMNNSFVFSTYVGMLIDTSQYFNITENNISDNELGMRFTHSNNNQIIGNVLLDNKKITYIYANNSNESNSSVIVDIIIEDNRDFELYQSYNNTFENNTLGSLSLLNIDGDSIESQAGFKIINNSELNLNNLDNVSITAPTNLENFTITKSLIVSNLSKLINRSYYNHAFFKFNNNLNNDRIFYLPDDVNGIVFESFACENNTEPVNVSENGCYINFSNSVTLFVPHFSGVILGNTSRILNNSEEVIPEDDDPPDNGNPGGGSSGGGLPPSNLLKVIKVFAEIEKDKLLEITINNTNIPVEAVKIVVNDTYSNIKISVEKIETKPSSLKTPKGIIYNYLSIGTTNIPDNSITDADIGFKVSLEWIRNNSINEDSIKLLRFHNEWQELKTNKISKDLKFVYYKAKTPGFSYFVINGEEKNEQINLTIEDSVINNSIHFEDDNVTGNELNNSSVEELDLTSNEKNYSYLIILLVLVLIFIGFYLIKNNSKKIKK